MAAKYSGANLGPGLLTIGAVGALVDASCQINHATITMSKNASDSKTMLCGDTIAGNTTYTYELGGNLDIDPATASGLFGTSQTEAGTETDFVFTPNKAVGTTAKGRLVLDPLDFGGGEYGAKMASDFKWAIVGKPVYTYGPAAKSAPGGSGGSEYIDDAPVDNDLAAEVVTE